MTDNEKTQWWAAFAAVLFVAVMFLMVAGWIDSQSLQFIFSGISPFFVGASVTYFLLLFFRLAYLAGKRSS